MLRRPLTTIRLTTEDVLDYDDSKQKENKQAASGSASSQNHASKSTGRPAAKKTREQRIGISQ
jgi:hypothetical protein